MTTTPRPRFLLAAALVAILALPATASAAQKVITPGGSSPLTNIYVNDNLGCQFTHAGDTHGEFFSGTNPGSCGTDISVNGATPLVYGHRATALTPVGTQVGPTGTGTTADPFKVTTIVDAGATGVRISQVDTYVAGQEAYRTRVTVQNTSAAARSGVLYHAADCYLGDDDSGYGFHDATTGGIYCTKTANNAPPDRLVGFVPLTSGAHYYESAYFDNYSKLAAGANLPDTCTCTVNQDNGASLSWSYSLGAAGSATASKVFNFATSSSPTGAIPDTTAPAVTVAQPASGASITDTTPTISGRAGNAAEDDPVVKIALRKGSTASGTLVGTFNVTRSGAAWSVTPAALPVGTYTVVATQGDQAGNVGTATRTFTIKAAPPANLEVTVTQSDPPILVGHDLTFTVRVRNLGPGIATGVMLNNLLPDGADLPAHEAGAAQVRRGTRAAAATCARSGRKMTCGVGTLGAGQSASYDFVVVPKRAGAMVNEASVQANEVDPVSSSNAGQAQTTAVRVPRITKTIDAAVVKGKVRYRKRGTKKFRTLSDQVELPVGSLVDATKGRVRLTSERDAKGHLQTADFYAGQFLLAQQRAQHGLTTLFLRGGSFTGCPAAGKADSLATAARKKKKKRGLWGSGKGSFRTGGRYGSATVRGTIWFTRDSCTSTFFKTKRGVVTVENYVTEEKVKVPKGKSYVAHAPKPKTRKAKGSK